MFKKLNTAYTIKDFTSNLSDWRVNPMSAKDQSQKDQQKLNELKQNILE